MKQNSRFEHIFYEFGMYENTYKVIINDYYPFKNEWEKCLIRNVFLESYYIHLRNIIDFFNKPNIIHDDDIYVDKILYNADEYRITIDKVVKDGLNKALSHLSDYRVTDLDKQKLWEKTNELYPMICNNINRFKDEIRKVENVKEGY